MAQAAPSVVTPIAAFSAAPNVQMKVTSTTQRLEMFVNTSRILTLEHKVPRLLVMNPEILTAQPISPNQIQVSARRTGVTQLNLWDENDRVYAIDVLISNDARELEALLKAEFPQATLKVRPIANRVVISGYVPEANMVSSIVQMAEDYYPSVINRITVGGVQQILLHVKIMEISRTRLRKLGIDWMHVNLGDPTKFGLTRFSGLISDYLTDDALIVRSGGETASFGVVSNGQGFFGLVEALRQNNLAKVLAEPTLTTVNGRAASFNSGGQVPVLVPQGLGNISVEYRDFGTRVDFVPITLPNGSVRLEVRSTVSDIDPSLSVVSGNLTVPGLRSRWVDTATEMKAGQTMAIAGLIQYRNEPENKGLPWLADLPWAGALFRRVEERQNEIELLIMVTPEFAAPLDPHQVPPVGPGESTVSPSDVEFYGRGYLEVPCCKDGSCPKCQAMAAFHANRAAGAQSGAPVVANPQRLPGLESQNAGGGANAPNGGIGQVSPSSPIGPPQSPAAAPFTALPNSPSTPAPNRGPYAGPVSVPNSGPVNSGPVNGSPVPRGAVGSVGDAPRAVAPPSPVAPPTAALARPAAPQYRQNPTVASPQPGKNPVGLIGPLGYDVLD